MDCVPRIGLRRIKSCTRHLEELRPRSCWWRWLFPVRQRHSGRSPAFKSKPWARNSAHNDAASRAELRYAGMRRPLHIVTPAPHTSPATAAPHIQLRGRAAGAIHIQDADIGGPRPTPILTMPAMAAPHTRQPSKQPRARGDRASWWRPSLMAADEDGGGRSRPPWWTVPTSPASKRH